MSVELKLHCCGRPVGVINRARRNQVGDVVVFDHKKYLIIDNPNFVDGKGDAEVQAVARRKESRKN